MYKEYFGFKEAPFSIVPSSRYLYLSQRHKEAMLHLQAGLGDGGGFAMLTGEVGTGKTTVAKAMLANLDHSTKAAFLLNPTFSSQDLLESICDEYGLEYPEGASLKKLHQIIHEFLKRNSVLGNQTLLVIDEAQHLDPDVLEQLRLLTNLETETRKLLKVLLVGQPELQTLLQTTQLRQLAQRITGRYHLLPLDINETADYIAFRIHTAGGMDPLFDRSSCKKIADVSHGIPRIINLICDKALQLCFEKEHQTPSRKMVDQACEHVMQFQADIYQQSDSPIAKARVKVPLKIHRDHMLWAGSALCSATLSALLLWSWPEASQPSEAEFQAYRAQLLEKGKIEDEQRLSLMQLSEITQAMEELYKVWGYHVDLADDTCSLESSTEFVCDTYQTDWQQLEAKQRPLIMQIEHKKEMAYVVLYGLSENWVELLNGSQRIRLPRSWFNEMWTGEVREIRPMPLRETLKQGDRGDAVWVLDQLLALHLERETLETRVFGRKMAARVSEFQEKQGMGVDGIAGRNTLARLQELTQLNVPKLITPQEDRSEQERTDEVN